jgi:hypothetical protein
MALEGVVDVAGSSANGKYALCAKAHVLCSQIATDVV